MTLRPIIVCKTHGFVATFREALCPFCAVDARKAAYAKQKDVARKAQEKARKAQELIASLKLLSIYEPRGELRELCRLGRQTFWLDALGRVFRSQERKPLQYVARSVERFFYDRLDPSLAAVYKLSDEGLRMYADFLERIAIMVRQAESQ